jgi:hypothetical protein
MATWPRRSRSSNASRERTCSRGGIPDPLDVAADEVGQDPYCLIESLEKEEVARAGHDPQRRIWDPLDEQPTALGRDDSVIVTGKDERWCSNQLQATRRVVREYRVDWAPIRFLAAFTT